MDPQSAVGGWMPRPRKLSAEIKRKTPIETNMHLNLKIRCIAARIIRASGVGKLQDWEVVVFRSTQVNAFALPGKKIGIYTGIIKMAQNNDQIAAVLGHEVGHVLARHGNERVSQTMLVQAGLTAANLVLLSKQSPKYRLLLAGLGIHIFTFVLTNLQKGHREL